MTTMKMIGCALIAVGLLPGVLAATTPRTNVAVEQANAFLDQTERDFDARLRADGSEPQATNARSAVLRTLHFVRRELAKLGDDAAVVIARVDRLVTRVAGPVAKMDGTGVIEGRVTATATGLPIAGAQIALDRANGQFVGVTSTDSEGAYQFTALPVAGYRVQVRAYNGFVDEVYDNISCTDGCSSSDGDVVSLGEGQVASGVDFILDQEAIIQGTIREASTGIPIPFLALRREGNGSGSSGSVTDIDGRYTFSGVGVGSHWVSTNSEHRFLDQVYDGIPCLQFPNLYCDPSVAGTPIFARLEQTISGIDFALEPGATLTGEIRGANTGVAVRDWEVTLYDSQAQAFHTGRTDDDGRYEIPGLPAGTYFALAHSGYVEKPFVDVLYDGILCPVRPEFGGCDLLSGTPIELMHNQSRTIDFALPRRGAVSGTVNDALSGEPLGGATVELFDDISSSVRETVTASNGSYRFENVVPVTHRARAYRAGYLVQLFEGLDCDPDCDLAQGTPIDVSVGAEATGVSFSLNRGGVIEGRLTVAETGLPPTTGFANLRSTGGTVWATPVDALGNFRFEGLPSDTYRVVAGGNGFLTEVWNNAHCSLLGCDGLGDLVSVVPGQAVTGIEIALDRGGEIRGRVLDAVTGGIPRFQGVQIWDEAGNEVDDEFSGVEQFTFEGLPPGRYRVSTSTFGTYVDQAWPGVACPTAGCDGSQGELIEVDFGSVVDGIDFALDPIGCQESSASMCLNQHRFRVEVGWRTPQGTMGKARPQRLSNDSGYLWFFDQDNVEAVVKVLDACSSPSNRFWIFAAGLTNVEAVLRVTDTWTNTARVYTNPLGTPFAPIQDTQAFATCEAQPPNGAMAPDTSPATATTVEPPATKGGCPYDPDTLCLGNGRFVVRARWTNPSGASGTGQAVQLTNDTGYLWFFNPDNVEVIVKVLDACSSPSQRFWVFAGGLTNVEVELEVLDTVTNEVKIYTNPLGTPFAPIQDTQAFDTCP